MRGAVGNALLLNVIIVIISIVMLFFVSIVSYAKAYKAKNRIVEVIEKYKAYDESESGFVDDIRNSLLQMGYQTGECRSDGIGNLNNSGFKYCVQRISTTCHDGETVCYYYRVTTYVQFYFPILGDLISPPVTSETKIFGDQYNY